MSEPTFDQGVMFACAVLCTEHKEPTMAKDILEQAGLWNKKDILCAESPDREVLFYLYKEGVKESE